jgi:hypothetical protein
MREEYQAIGDSTDSCCKSTIRRPQPTTRGLPFSAKIINRAWPACRRTVCAFMRAMAQHRSAHARHGTQAFVDLMLEIHAGAYSIEAANRRHEHEWQVWQEVTHPMSRRLCQIGCHCITVVEHPELVA